MTIQIIAPRIVRNWDRGPRPDLAEQRDTLQKERARVRQQLRRQHYLLRIWRRQVAQLHSRLAQIKATLDRIEKGDAA